LKKNKNTKNWLTKRNREHFFKKAKVHGYRSRSAYKLIEMNNKFKFIKKESLLLDLGSSPGGWSQVASEIIYSGKILAADIKNMEKIKKVNFILNDVNDKDFYLKVENFFNRKIDIVISDMAANTTGNKNLDSYRTGELCLNALDLASKVLNEKGVFLSKIFMGSIFNEIQEKAKKYFKKVIKYKPLSSKSESKEIYIFCKDLSKI
tara:strand:- start:1108 stop:1725 length:618 start_codon:yes stop_codon:yes gene_type:complete